jgi:hypothetical protein
MRIAEGGMVSAEIIGAHDRALWARFLSQRYRRRQDAAWEKRARCGSAVLDVCDGKDTGRDRLLSPAAQRGPEGSPVRRGAEAFGGTAAPSWEGTPAPKHEMTASLIRYRPQRLSGMLRINHPLRPEMPLRRLARKHVRGGIAGAGSV